MISLSQTGMIARLIAHLLSRIKGQNNLYNMMALASVLDFQQSQDHSRPNIQLVEQPTNLKSALHVCQPRPNGYLSILLLK
jgi:hypothetical protein